MFGLRRKFKVPGKDIYYAIFGKPWGSSLGIPMKDKLNYLLVETKDFKSFKIIDNPGEDDGFDTYGAAEQFLRAYLTGEYGVMPNRWYLNLFKKKGNGYLEDVETKKEVKY